MSQDGSMWVQTVNLVKAGKVFKCSGTNPNDIVKIWQSNSIDSR